MTEDITPAVKTSPTIGVDIALDGPSTGLTPIRQRQGPKMVKIKIVGMLALLASSPSFAQAQEKPASAAADAGPAPICTDRPGKNTSACTVPKGSFQLETDLINWTRFDSEGTRTDTILYTNPTLKYGLTSSTDIEANIAPFETIRTRDGSGVSKMHGVGDLYLRVKQRLTSPDAKAQFAVIPFIKIPTAKFGIGNRKLEGGVVGTGVFTLSKEYSLTFSPEVDDLENADLHGHHGQFVAALSLAKTLSSKLTASAELWTSQNYDPSGTLRQYSFDGALAYVPSSNLQFDGGVNVGLNRFTPGVQAYVGISRRF